MNPSLLIIIAIVLMILELFVPSFGLLGIAGLVSLVVGFLGYLETLDPSQRETALWLAVPSFIVLLGLFAVAGAVLFKGRRTLFQKGEIAPVGEVGEAADDFVHRHGMIRVDGEIWTAELIDEKTTRRGDKLLVLTRNGLKLTVQNVHQA